ncbi:hypothetical protein SEUBUCD646_0B03900 [Saccharomyces eubayanus]|uniref:Uncharacterized protein n=2 Tax=Saccharomyces TaxID=4930 RepID=A0A6C1E2U8_SACPS|nr:PHM6-like protein [Saccharomyces eubayanus]KOH01108.1 PHM6-like protein [Saccharomyces eubayanus]QID83602.1 hypothetical protein GRS66_006072 [Saccharomyces pastorianus]CAI1840230.1 hypothetical protein SEUBUCD650_0B03910 [Saccharomyces eubayanus]CAI1874801.1 hypothetical protein SEUBUCD646_0B03900 [Saccharomyces eubayanus]
MDTSKSSEVLKMEQQEKETLPVKLVTSRGEEEKVKSGDYMIDLEAGLLPHEVSEKGSTFKQYRDAFVGFIEELVIIVVIVLLLYFLTMIGLFYVMAMTKVLF